MAATEASLPTLEEVRAWIGIQASVIPDDQLATVMAAELAAQAQACTVQPWAFPLTQALYRRVGREVAAMSLPLGVLDTASEYGGANIPRFDAEIERLERPFRLTVLG
jgi:hypothetical protein